MSTDRQTDRPTDQQTDRHSLLQRCLEATKNDVPIQFVTGCSKSPGNWAESRKAKGEVQGLAAAKNLLSHPQSHPIIYILTMKKRIEPKLHEKITQLISKRYFKGDDTEKWGFNPSNVSFNNRTPILFYQPLFLQEVITVVDIARPPHKQFRVAFDAPMNLQSVPVSQSVFAVERGGAVISPLLLDVIHPICIGTVQQNYLPHSPTSFQIIQTIIYRPTSFTISMKELDASLVVSLSGLLYDYRI